MRRGTLSPSALFDAAVHPSREDELATEGLEVVARPGMAPPAEADPALFAIKRGLGEGRLAVVSAVERVVGSRALLEAEGIPCEGHRDGIFIEVDGGPAGRRGLRIAGVDGVMSRDVVLLRERPSVRRASGPTPRPAAEDVTPTTRATLIAAALAVRRRRGRSIREDHLRALLEPATGTSPLLEDLQRAAAELERRRPGDGTGQPASSAVVDQLASGLVDAAERAFILDVQRSTLDLLAPAERARYLGFAWHADDFPGGPPGPNEARANGMFAALTRLRPERRANQGETAVVRVDEFDAAMRRRVDEALVVVPARPASGCTAMRRPLSSRCAPPPLPTGSRSRSAARIDRRNARGRARPGRTIARRSPRSRRTRSVWPSTCTSRTAGCGSGRSPRGRSETSWRCTGPRPRSGCSCAARRTAGTRTGANRGTGSTTRPDCAIESGRVQTPPPRPHRQNRADGSRRWATPLRRHERRS